jgi:hypothetical protein
MQPVVHVLSLVPIAVAFSGHSAREQLNTFVVMGWPNRAGVIGKKRLFVMAITSRAEWPR